MTETKLKEDWNFCLPLNLDKLQNDRLSLVPFDSNLEHYASLYVQTTSEHPRNFDFLSYGPFPDTQSFMEWHKQHMQSDKSVVWFAILLRKCTIRDIEYPDDTFAGACSYLSSSYEHACTEIGHINILPPFQRSFVATHMNGLLLRYALNPATSTSTSPSPSNGLGLRRVQWCANALNSPSVTAAKRLGFRYEGTLRWHRVVPANKPSDEVHAANNERLPDTYGLGQKHGQQHGQRLGTGRDTAVLSVCWDDWVGLVGEGGDGGYGSGGGAKGVARHIERLMER